MTPLDVLEAIAGEFPDADETPEIVADGDGWLVKGTTTCTHSRTRWASKTWSMMMKILPPWRGW
ncbi:hypothetical protein ACVXG7_20810 [Enterobacter hormaechei]